MPYRYITQQAQLLRSYYAGFGKPGVIYPATFLVAFAQGTVNLGLIFFMRERFQASASAIGWLSALWSTCYVVGCLVVRPALSQVRPRHLVLLATGSAFTFTLAMHIAHSMTLIFVLMGLYGTAMSLFWPPIMGWLSADAEGQGLGRMVSRFNLCWSIGGILSPVAAGALSDVAVGLPIYVGSAVFIVATVFLAGAIAALPGARTDQPAGDDGQREAAPSGRSTLLRYPAWVRVFAVFFGLGVVTNIFPLIAHDTLGFSRTTIGGLLLIRALTAAAGFALLGSLTFWHFRAAPMIVGQGLGVAVFVLFAWVNSAVAVGALLAVVGVVVSMGYSSSIFHGVSGSANRSGRMAVHEAILSCGAVAGSGIGGMVYQSWHGASAYWLSAGVLLVGIAIQAPLCIWSNSRERGHSTASHT